MLMQKINVICSKDSSQPGTDMTQLKNALLRKKSLIDFRLADIAAAKTALRMDSVHAQKLDTLVNGWREAEMAVVAELAAIGTCMPGPRGKDPRTTRAPRTP